MGYLLRLLIALLLSVGLVGCTKHYHYHLAEVPAPAPEGETITYPVLPACDGTTDIDLDACGGSISGWGYDELEIDSNCVTITTDPPLTDCYDEDGNLEHMHP